MSSREKLHQAIEKLTDKQLEMVKNSVDALLDEPGNEEREELKKIRAVRFGREIDAERKRFEPIKVEGELPSEILIRERR